MSDNVDSIPEGYYRDDNGILKQIALNAVTTDKAQSPLSASELAALEKMDKAGLISLIKRLPAKITGYALQTKEERREAMRMRIYDIAMCADNDAVVLKAANDWLDREEGKAMQRQMTAVAVTGFSIADILAEISAESADEVLK